MRKQRRARARAHGRRRHRPDGNLTSPRRGLERNPNVTVLKPEVDSRTGSKQRSAPAPAPQHVKKVADSRRARGRDVVTLAGVEPRALLWLWQGRLAYGRIALLDGDPDSGKSLVTLDIASRVSRGEPMPEEGEKARPPADVVVIAAEDGLADTVRPRIDAAGGDPERVHVLKSIGGEVPTLDRHLPQIEDEIRRRRARLLIVDPLNAHLAGAATVDQRVRRALVPVAEMAERTGACVLLVRHLAKAGRGRAMHRGLGSVGLIAQARTGMLLGRDPEDSNGRILAPTKSNLSEAPFSLRLRIVGVGKSAGIVWGEPSDISADELVAAPRPPRRLAEAQHFLEDFLGSGPQPVEEVLRAAQEKQIAEPTLRRAKDLLNVVVRKDYDNGNRWRWSLPDPDVDEQPHAGGKSP
jgi:putative DNA primase/helicase